MQVLPALSRFKYPKILFVFSNVIVVEPAEIVEATLVRISYFLSALYPEPLFPIEIDEIVPATETTAVAPAETKGW